MGVATDGRRLHKAPVTVPDGYYHKSGVYYTKEQFQDNVGTFPNWERVIPDGKEVVSINPEKFERVKDSGGVWTVRSPEMEGFALNEQFFNDLDASGSGEIMAIPRIPGQKYYDPLIYTDGERFGILMPMRVD